MTLLSYPQTDDYGKEPAPSTATTVGMSLVRPIGESQLFLNKAAHWAFGEQLDTKLQDSIDLIDYQLANPQIGGRQQLTNAVAGLAGNVLDPVQGAFALVGGELLGGAARVGMDLFPDAIAGLSEHAISREAIDGMLKNNIPLFQNNKFARHLPKNFHDVIERVSEAAGAFSGFSIPDAFNQSYNADQDRLDYGGMAKIIAINGGIGFAFPPVLWALGIIAGRAGVKSAETEAKAVSGGYPPGGTAGTLKTEEKLQIANQALEEGKITPDEHDFYTRFHVEPADEAGHLDRARQVLHKEKHPVNALTGNIDVPFLTAEDVTQLQQFAVDQMSSSVSGDYKYALTNFVSHKVLDRMTEMMRSNPSMIEGMISHLDAIAKKLEGKVKSLEKGDVFIERNLRRAEERQQPLSQEKLAKMMEQGNLSHREMPFVVPDNVKGVRLREVEIKRLTNLAKDYDRAHAKSGKTIFKKKASKVRSKLAEKELELSEYKANHPIKTQAKELDAIEEKLLSKNGLPEKYQINNDYLRLLDLAHVSSRARSMVERVRLREQYEAQQSLHDFMRGIADLAESGMNNIANPQKVVNYLKERMDTGLDIPAINETIDKKISDVDSAASEAVDAKETSIDAQVKSIQDNPDISSETKEELAAMREKIRQFKGADQFKMKLINCMVEAAGVSI